MNACGVALAALALLSEATPEESFLSRVARGGIEHDDGDGHGAGQGMRRVVGIGES